MSKSETLRSSSSPSDSPFSFNDFASSKSFKKLTASTTVTIVSNDATSDNEIPSSSANVNVSATGSGSDIPVDSITKLSKRPSWANFPTSISKSSRNVQQMHPLLISTSFSSL